MGDASSLGFGHFIAQSDIVAKVLLAVLVIMSAISWYLIVYKGISQVVRQKRSARFLAFFWSATSLEQVQNELNIHGVHEPFGHLTHQFRPGGAAEDSGHLAEIGEADGHDDALRGGAQGLGEGAAVGKAGIGVQHARVAQGFQGRQGGGGEAGGDQGAQGRSDAE